MGCCEGCLSLGPPAAEPQLRKTTNLKTAAQENKRYVDARKRHDSTIVPETIKLHHDEVALGLQALQKSAAADMVRLSFSHMHTAQAAAHFNGQHPSASITMMNFANGRRAGGGYMGGSKAQEEALCRQFPMYHPSMANKQSTLYPFGAAAAPQARGRVEHAQARREYSAVLFTPPTPMLRDDVERQLCPLPGGCVFNASFVAAAAPCLDTKKTVDHLDEDLLNEAIENCILGSGMHQRLREPAQQGQTRILILGAWGCGAFGNDPSEMAKRFTRVLGDRRAEVKQLWSEVHFAVPAFRAEDNKNQDGFERALLDLCEKMSQTVCRISLSQFFFLL